MLYAVNFRNEREELIIRAIEAQNEEEAAGKAVKSWEEEYEEKIHPMFHPKAFPVISGQNIYHGHR